MTHETIDTGPLTKSHPGRWYEAAMVGVSVVAALWLWLYRIADFPSGLHFDEAIDLWAGLRVMAGDYQVYVERGWGREALYYYPLALVLRWVSDTWLALKLTAVGFSVGILLTLYGFIRRRTHFFTAWFAASWYVVLFWVMYLSRSGNRAISLPFMLILTAGGFWWAWDTPPQENSRKMWRYAAAGGLLGATLYTYQAARFVPFLFLAFFGYVAIFHRELLRQNGYGWLMLVGVAVVIALPLGVILLRNPLPEQSRDWTIEPYTQMMQGNFSPVWQNIIAAAKMFSWSGDPLVSYNVPHRPVFVPVWTGVFFYGGVFLALWRWRQPFYAFMLLWLGVMLAPTILTISTPNHLRASAALPAIVFFAALAPGELIAWCVSRAKYRYGVMLFLLGVVTLFGVGRASWQDYFHVWSTSKGTDWERNYNVRMSAIAKYLRAHLDARPVVISTNNIEDIDPSILEVVLRREDVVFRWVDTTQAFVMPANRETARLMVAAGRWIDADLSDYLNLSAAPAIYTEHFSLLDVNFADVAWEAGAPLRVIPVGTALPVNPQILPEHSLPIVLHNDVQLVAVKQLPDSVQPGQTLTFFTAWEVVLTGDNARALAMFTHVFNANGELVAQQDSLGYPLNSWRQGDRFIQVHHIPLTADLPAGEYWIQLGIYERGDGQRWLVDGAGDYPADRILIGAIQVLSP